MSKEKKFMSILVHIITRDIDLASGGKKLFSHWIALLDTIVNHLFMLSHRLNEIFPQAISNTLLLFLRVFFWLLISFPMSFISQRWCPILISHKYISIQINKLALQLIKLSLVSLGTMNCTKLNCIRQAHRKTNNNIFWNLNLTSQKVGQ